jgi:hypothetical protein
MRGYKKKGQGLWPWPGAGSKKNQLFLAGAGAAAAGAAGAAAGAAAVAAGAGVYTKGPGSAQAGKAGALGSFLPALPCLAVWAATLSCDLHSRKASTLAVCAVLAAVSAALALASSLKGGSLAKADTAKVLAARRVNTDFIKASLRLSWWA